MSPTDFNALPTPRTTEFWWSMRSKVDDLVIDDVTEKAALFHRQLEREVALLERALKECADYGDEPSIASLRTLAAIRSAVERANEKEQP